MTYYVLQSWWAWWTWLSGMLGITIWMSKVLEGSLLIQFIPAVYTKSMPFFALRTVFFPFALDLTVHVPYPLGICHLYISLSDPVVTCYSPLDLRWRFGHVEDNIHYSGMGTKSNYPWNSYQMYMQRIRGRLLLVASVDLFSCSFLRQLKAIWWHWFLHEQIPRPIW